MRADAPREADRSIGELLRELGDELGALRYKADVRARVKDAVNQRVETVRGTIMEAVGGISETVGAMTTVDRLPRPEDVRSVARRGAGIVGENALGLAFGALAAGFVAGLLAPVSDRGRTKDGAMGRR
jgi:hypothetical protein